MPARALLADIGGTNTRVAQAEGGVLIDGSIRHYRNAGFTALEPVLHRYLMETGAPAPEAACLAMAGPVRDGVGRLTNLDWTLDTATLAAATGARHVALLNDLQAQGHALGHLAPEALNVLVRGQPTHAGAAQLVIGVGTGFNAAPVYNTRTGRYVPPSESGHITLPVRTEADLRLAQFIAARHGFAAVEEVLSGRGLGMVHDWLCHEAQATPGADSAEILRRFAAGDARARAAICIFARVLGAVAGDLALIQLPFGGVFLVGGMARALAPHLASCGFIESFCDKGRFSGFMAQFAVTVVADDDAALIGSARHLDALMSAH